MLSKFKGGKVMNKKFSILAFLLIFSLLLAACSGGGKKESNGSKNGEDKKDEGLAPVEMLHDSSLEGEITVWSWGAWEEQIEIFNELYPNIKVNLVQQEIDALHDNLQTTLTAGKGAPDVSHVLNVDRYGTPGLLEDLLDPQYDMGRYKHLAEPYVWERWMSLDGKRLLAPPWDIGSGVFYYREDIYEQMGLPSDPEELGEFLQDPENVFQAAQTLAANDIYMYEFRDSPAIQYGDAVGYFDENLNYMRNDERMIELLDHVKRGVQLGWAPQLSAFFSEEGNNLLKQGKIASLPVASNAYQQFSRVVPEQSGKWRATKMPFGVNVSLVGSSWVIPSQSQQKDAAFAFVEFMSVNEEAWKLYQEGGIQTGWKHIAELPWYQEYENEYFGGQKDFAFYNTLVPELPVRRYTPLDGAAWPLYIDKINESIDKNIDSRTTLQQIEDNTMKQLESDIEKLKEEYGIE